MSDEVTIIYQRGARESHALDLCEPVFIPGTRSTSVLNLNTARASRAAEAERRDAVRPFVLHVVLTSFAVLPPGADLGAAPEVEMLDAADLVSDPGKLGEIARAMVARVEAAKDRSADHA